MTLLQIIVLLTPAVLGVIISLLFLGRMKLYGENSVFTSKNVPTDKEAGLLELGGIAFFPILLVVVCISLGLPEYLGMDSSVADKVVESVRRILQLIAGASILFFVGLKHDMNGSSLQARFLALLLSACMLPISGLWITSFQGLFGIYEIPVWIGMPLTVFLVMCLTEILALLDDLDGLGGGLMFLIAALYFRLFAYYGFTLGAIVASATLGVPFCYFGLKLFSKKWKRTLMGRSGAYVLGYLLSYMTLAIIQQSQISMPRGTIMICLGILALPLLDMMRVLWRRLKDFRTLNTPDRNFMQHRHFRAGVSRIMVPPVIILEMLGFAALNYLWVMNKQDLTLLFFINIVLYLGLQLILSASIGQREKSRYHDLWEMSYGKEVWEADVPKEVIIKKHKDYGTMGLPDEVILGDEMGFIPDGMGTWERVTKRTFDFMVAAVLLIVFSPIILICYLAIKLDDGGPAIYKQERIGRFGRPFHILKFRSMKMNAESAGPALSTAGGDGDPRLTKAGAFLRKHHLDELPQLWNVFCGDMSLVGYRPERQFFIDQIMEHDPRYTFLYQIRPGVTSYATLYNGYTDTMEKMLRRLTYDLYYLEHRSWRFDLNIAWLTFARVFSGKDV